MNNKEVKLTKPYNPKDTEDRIYSAWKESDFFNPDTCIEKGVTKPDSPHFSIVLPPPNVTGTLHMGSAYMIALEDIMVRYSRMKGMRTLWIPGTDHAAIATQSKVEKEIQKKEGKNRFDLGREEMLKRIELFAKESHDTIVSQIIKLGASLDWSREAFTLDEKRNLAVKTAFKKMFDTGIIYRGHRIVNWDPKGQTTISDDELVYAEEKATLYYLKYGPFTISTARPETKFGDKYVVIHPKDERYKEYKHNQKIELEWINGPITATVIKDESIDMEFGTGVMTITPWHDKVDFEIAERHKLEKQQVIDKYGKLLDIAGEFAGIKIKDAREKIVEKLNQKGLIVKTEEYTHNIATAERTGGVIEPQIMDQWFINVNKEFEYEFDTLPNIKKGEKVSLKKLMLSVIKENSQSINIIPDRFEKIYKHWIENLNDWCISRQIWYGHRIPVWYRGDEVYCDIEAPKEAGFIQDEDTLDTWFSSGLWTFSTLGWPEKDKDLQYHPTTVLETGYDILFFWVARMILMSTYLLGQVPFQTVYLHGLVRDGQGRKISKSLGNNIDPVNMIEKYGADAVRMALIVAVGPGNDSKMSEEKCKAYKLFANKIWNIARFIKTSTEKIEGNIPLSPENQKLVDDFDKLIKEITKEMEEFRFYLVSEKLYNFIWRELADKILEESKPILSGQNEEAKKERSFVLNYILKNSLKALHPFMPFITEELWSILEYGDKMLIVESWPVVE